MDCVIHFVIELQMVRWIITLQAVAHHQTQFPVQVEPCHLADSSVTRIQLQLTLI